MSFLNNIITGKVKKPIYACLYSGPGIGKTTFASSAPDVLFLDIERSSDNLDVARLRPKDFDEVMGVLTEIYNADTISYKSLAIDTIDRFELLIHKRVADDNEKESINDIGFQKGFIYALEYWHKFLRALTAIQDKHNIHIILLAHATVKRFNDPHINEDYDRFEIKIHHKAADLVKESVEMLLFAKKDVSIKKERGAAKSKAFNVNERFIYTQLEAAFDAKNRIGLPARIEMPENNAFSVLFDSYNKASGETPEDLYRQCHEAIKRIMDDDLRKQMIDYTEKHKQDINILRATLERIIDKTKEL